MRIYISGKISGLPKAEYESSFKNAEELFRKMGYQPVNPCELAHTTTKWDECMLRDIKALFDCEAIYMLNNWRSSKGARIEHAIAIETGMKILYQP